MVHMQRQSTSRSFKAASKGGSGKKLSSGKSFKLARQGTKGILVTSPKGRRSLTKKNSLAKGFNSKISKKESFSLSAERGSIFGPGGKQGNDSGGMRRIDTFGNEKQLSAQNMQRAFRNSRASLLERRDSNERTESRAEKKPSYSARRKSQLIVKQNTHLKERTTKMWGKIKKIGKLSAMLGHLSGESERAKKQRVKERWDIVRKVARAAMSLSAFTQTSSGSDVIHTQRSAINNFPVFAKAIVKNPNSRTEKDLDLLVSSTKHLAFFRSGKLDRKQHREICRSMKMQQHRTAHDIVFNEGDPGKEFYIIIDGSVAIRKRNAHGRGSLKLAVLSAGEGFGEIALMQDGVTRTASVITEEPCNLIVVHKEDFVRVLKEAEMQKFEAQLRFHHTAPAMRHLSPDTLFHLARVMNTKKFKVGEYLAHQGELIDPLDFVILVRRGEVRVAQNVVSAVRGTLNLTVCVLGPFEALVDAAILGKMDDPENRYAASFVARTAAEVFIISKHDLSARASKDDIKMLQKNVITLPTPAMIAEIHSTKQKWKKYRKSLMKEIVAKSSHPNVLRKTKAERVKEMHTLARRWAREKRHKERMENKMAKLKAMAAERDKRQGARSRRKASKMAARRSLFGSGMVITESALETDFEDSSSDENNSSDGESTDDDPERKLASSRRARVLRVGKFVREAKALTRNVYQTAISEGANYFAQCELVTAL